MSERFLLPKGNLAFITKLGLLTIKIGFLVLRILLWLFNRLEKGLEQLEPGELTGKGEIPALLTASGLSPAECGNQRRGAAGREPIVEVREKLRVRAINQFESRGDWRRNGIGSEAADYSVLLDLSGDAAVSGILRVWM
jgi:hypothetical protein